MEVNLEVPQKKQRNIISASKLCRILRIKDLRSLQTTKRFPKPTMKNDELVFNSDKVAEFFGVENLNEPFIDAIEAAEFLKTGRPNIHSMAARGILPSYRLKVAKGSAFLFRKSELEPFISADIERNPQPLNFMVAYDAMSGIVESLLDQVSNKDSREYKIMKMFLFGRMKNGDIADAVGLSKQRVNQICDKVIKRMKEQKFYSALDYISLERVVIAQQKEIADLKELVNLRTNLDNNVEYNESLNYFKNTLSKSVADLDLSVRSLNALGRLRVKSVYDLARFIYLDDGYSKMRGERSVGVKSISEIQEEMQKVCARIELNTGLSLVNILRTARADESRVFLIELEKRLSC